MTQPTVNLTQSNIFTALRSFLLAVLPTGIEVIRAQTNRVPEPKGPDFVIMTPIMMPRLETNTVTYTDNYPLGASIRNDMEPIKVTIQLDVHGPNSANNTQLITTYFRSSFGCDQFATSGFDIAPLYNETPKQIAFKNGEQQIEERWIVDCVMQANPVGTVPQQFASTLKVGVISVNEKYPPA